MRRYGRKSGGQRRETSHPAQRPLQSGKRRPILLAHRRLRHADQSERGELTPPGRMEDESLRWYDHALIKIIPDPRLIRNSAYITPNHVLLQPTSLLLLLTPKSCPPPLLFVQASKHDRPPQRFHQPGCRGSLPSQGRRYPRHGDVFPQACTYPRVVRAPYVSNNSRSAFRRRSSKSSTTSPRASTPSVLARSSWHVVTTAKTLTPSHSPV